MHPAVTRSMGYRGHLGSVSWWCAVLTAIAFAVVVGPADVRAQHTRHATGRSRQSVEVECGDPLTFQVRLDREGFSPGEIDGRLGPNALRALRAFQDARRLTPSGRADCDTWTALGGDAVSPALITHEITTDEVKGPFTRRIPRELPAQASLPALGYTSALEALSERFHSAPALLKRLNPRAQFAAGERIQVADVVMFDPDAKVAHDAAAGDITVRVSRQDSSLRVVRNDGTLVFFAPVSSGSVHDPLPPGMWKVTSVNFRPVFHYNPALFWDASPKDSRVELKPGPNNPVGVVWIGLDLEHYGLHGTPNPSRISATESHGCVRLTNWDATRLAALVQPGTPVIFE